MAPKPRHQIPPQKTTQRQPSIMQAFETAVLLMEQAGMTEEDILKMVHMVHMGWIREGQLSPEYLELIQQVQTEHMREQEEQARVQAVRQSVLGSTELDLSLANQAIITDIK